MRGESAPRPFVCRAASRRPRHRPPQRNTLLRRPSQRPPRQIRCRDTARQHHRRSHTPGATPHRRPSGATAAGLAPRSHSERHPKQSTATSKAAHMARIRVSASRPSLLTKTATDTLSNESRFTAERQGIGSESGSRTTSLESPRMVVVHGATNARRSRGIAASRDNTTTGRRPISANSHHQTSPRAGSAITRRQLPAATTPSHPTRRAH
jgi:hypothetical protein